MKPQFGDEASPRERQRRAETIRARFTGATIAAHTELCIDSGLWSDFELRARATRSCREEVRDALKAPRSDGMPFAAQSAETEGGAPSGNS